jgi:arginyl-tRNA--protein-N-Asp/Glu arginylyltransferase
MFTEKHYLDHLTLSQLDDYLRIGWYRMGQAMFTCRFLIFDYQLYSALWVRLPLLDYKYSKSSRKLLRRNSEQFRVITRPAVIDEEKEVLYQKYRLSFHGRIAPSLKISLLDDTDHTIFDTYETCIYDGDRLIAFSFFDLGNETLASITGIYDPDYKKSSLGFFTMLLEIEFGIQNNMIYYYPGYVVPGYDRFDYKLRIGEVECFHEKENEWVPYTEFPVSKLQSEILKDRLEAISLRLSVQRTSFQTKLYPPYEANLIGYWILDYLEYPYFIECKAPGIYPYRMILIFDHLKEVYRLVLCSVYDDLSDFFISGGSPPNSSKQLEFGLLIKEEILAESPSADVMAEIIANELNKRSRNR